MNLNIDKHLIDYTLHQLNNISEVKVKRQFFVAFSIDKNCGELLGDVMLM